MNDAIPKCWLSRTFRALGVILQNRFMEDSLLERIGIHGLSRILSFSTEDEGDPFYWWKLHNYAVDEQPRKPWKSF